MRRVLLIIIAIFAAAGIAVGGIALLSGAFKKAEERAAAAKANPAPVIPAPVVTTDPTQQLRRVVIFVRNKQVGEHVDASNDLTVSLMPVGDVPEDAFTSLDVSSDPRARNQINDWEVLRDVQSGEPARSSGLQAPENGTPVEPQMQPEEEPKIKGNPADVAFLDELTNDPAIVLFDEAQLSSLRLRSGVLVDITVESPAAGFGDGTWVGREIVVTGATLRATSLDVTGKGAVPVFYAKLTGKQADKVRAAQAIANGQLKVEPHRDERALPPIGHICVGPQDKQVCFEALPDEEAPADADEQPVEETGKAQTKQVTK